jgi:hypothetical protein
MYGICPAFMTTRELPGRGIWRFRTDELEYINRQDLVHSTGQPLSPEDTHRLHLLPLRTFRCNRCNRRAYERWRSAEKGVTQAEGRSNRAYKSRRMRLEVIHQRTAHSTSQRTDSYAKSKHAGSRVVVEAAISIGGSK